MKTTMKMGSTPKRKRKETMKRATPPTRASMALDAPPIMSALKSMLSAPQHTPWIAKFHTARERGDEGSGGGGEMEGREEGGERRGAFACRLVGV